MKVTLVFCLIALYGAVAQESTDGTTTESTTDDSSSSDSGITIGSALELVNDMVQNGISAKENSVAKGVGLLNTTVTEVAGLGINIVANATDLAQNAIDLGGNIAKGGMNVAEKVVNQTMDFVDSIPVVGKLVPTSIIKGIFGKGVAIGGKAVNAGTTAGKAGAALGGKVGKGVLGGVGAGAIKVNGAIVAGDKAANAVASNMATASMNGVSTGIKGVGSMIASAGNKLSTSATLPTASATTDSTTTA